MHFPAVVWISVDIAAGSDVWVSIITGISLFVLSVYTVILSLSLSLSLLKFY